MTAFSQARLSIENNSGRELTVKVMKTDGGNGTLIETVTINAYNNRTVYFEQSGTYFTKSKAVLYGKNPVYKKGQLFEVTNDSSGYSILTLTFSIKESALSNSSGRTISKSEFDQN